MALSNERMSGSGRADRRCTFGAIKDEHLGKDSVSFVMVCTLRSTQPSVSELSTCCRSLKFCAMQMSMWKCA